jgi:glycosyltransferase involved in cell wall biosynthesis
VHILILVDCYYPGTKSSDKLIHDLGVQLHREGHVVTVVTPSEAVSQGLELSTEDGLRVVRIKTGKIKGASKIFRAFQEVRLSPHVWRQSKYFFLQNACDLIIFYSPTIFFGSLVRRLKTLWGCPAYLILRDIFPEWTVSAGILRKGLIYRFFRAKEIEQYEIADIIAVQSPTSLEYFAREFPQKPYRLEVLYNWSALREPDLPPTNYRSQLGLQNKIVFFHGGNHGLAQDVENILCLAASLVGHTHIYFLLVGDGSEVSGLKKSIAARGLRNIQVLPPVSQREYLSMLSEFDVGLISLDRRLTTHNVPGKMLGYMYWGLPILASINPGNDLFEILQKSEAGFSFVNGDDKSLSAAALRLANDPELRSKLGKNSRQLLERSFSAQAAVRQIMEHLSRTVPAAEPVEAMLASAPLRSTGGAT